MREIQRDQLKAKLDRKESLKLVMVMSKGAFDSLHIPGSIYFASVADALNTLKTDDEIVVYCTGKPCLNSYRAYLFLENRGYHKVYYYAGGLPDWEAAGYPLEGTMARRPGGAS